MTWECRNYKRGCRHCVIQSQNHEAVTVCRFSTSRRQNDPCWNNREEPQDRVDFHLHSADMSAANVIEVNKLDVIHFGSSTYFVNVVFECDSCLYATVTTFGQETLLYSTSIMQKEQCCSQSRSGRPAVHTMWLSTGRESWGLWGVAGCSSLRHPDPNGYSIIAFIANELEVEWH